MPYIEKTSYFEVAPCGHTIAYIDIDYLFKNDMYTYPYLLYKA